MNVLLMTYRDLYCAVDMRRVSRIIEPPADAAEDADWLWTPDRETEPVLGVRLKNGRLLPAHSVQKMIPYPGDAVPPGRFLDGCMTRRTIDGFLPVDGRVYGLLSPAFLDNVENKE